MTLLPVLAVTSGEPAGVGPELCLRLSERAFPEVRLVILGDARLMAERARLSGISVTFREAGARQPAARGTLDILDIPLMAESLPGRPDPANAPYVLRLLDEALAGCRSGRFAAMVTAPVHKGIINDAGIAFMGHTEYLAEKTGTPRVVMMLAGANLRVALVTTHLALKDVPAAITPSLLEETVRILHHDLKRKYGMESPRILVAGLNPHAGEGGYLGREEIEVIQPVLNRLRNEGMSLIGPLPADTLFTKPLLSQGDCVLSMYHDQGLTVLKYASFGDGINVTLGLPILRTSVDHGTALDIAGTGKADPGSLFKAIEEAGRMARYLNG